MLKHVRYFITYTRFSELIMLHKLMRKLGGAAGIKKGLIRRYEQITVCRSGKI